MGGIDDFIRQMAEDELLDKVETTTHATPIEYARARGMMPQKVYYALRNHRDKLNTKQCQCGRKVLDIRAADNYFGFDDAENEDDTEVPRQSDDTGQEVAGDEPTEASTG